jgi:probable rRNA maturation factor
MGELWTGIEDPIIDISIDTGSPEMDAEVEQLLETLEAEEVIKETLRAVHVHLPVELALLVTGETKIQELNRQYRRQDKPTDVLSFPLLDVPLVKAPAEWLWQVGDQESEFGLSDKPKPAFVTPAELATNLGDIVISWPTVQHQASVAGHNASYELLFLLCHGVLHLVGYDDQTEAGYTEMVRLQTEILAGFQGRD